jgi:hypothetical protein
MFVNGDNLLGTVRVQAEPMNPNSERMSQAAPAAVCATVLAADRSIS